jgi:phosphatidate cytidylyltransferase
VKRVLTAVVLIPLVILALFRAPLWLFTLLVLGVALLAAREYFGIAKASGFRAFHGIGYASLALLFGVFYLIGDLPESFPGHQGSVAASGLIGMLMFYGVPAIAIFVPLILLAAGLTRNPLSHALPDAAASYIVIPYAGLTLALLVPLRGFRYGALFLLFLMLLVWCGDVAAYYVGRAMGKHKLAPRISPGKTWEGSIASVIGAVIVGVLLFHYINPVANALRSAHLLVEPAAKFQPRTADVPRGFSIAPIWFVVVFAICVNVAAQIGDLVESALKRGAGLKDSGTLLPGHGGVLDRIDALLFALPVGLVFYVIGMSRYFELSAIR